MWLMELVLVIRYVCEEICMIGTPEADDKAWRMNVHLMVGSSSCSLTKECKRLCDDEVRINGVKGYSKHKKRGDT